MKCIDFDKAFARYATQWFREHAKEYRNYDAMEAAVPDVYERFLPISSHMPSLVNTSDNGMMPSC